MKSIEQFLMREHYGSFATSLGKFCPLILLCKYYILVPVSQINTDTTYQVIFHQTGAEMSVQAKQDKLLTLILLINIILNNITGSTQIKFN